MSNPNPVSCKQVQNLHLVFIKISEFINFKKANFIKMSLLSFYNFYCQIMDFESTKQIVSTDTCISPPAILNPINPPLLCPNKKHGWQKSIGKFINPGLVSWFDESGFGLRKFGLNKHKGFSCDLSKQGLIVRLFLVTSQYWKYRPCWH